MKDFVHLHNHSSIGSLLDGMSSPQGLAARAKELEQSAIALTDHGLMAGLPDFYEACQKTDTKPILGLEGYISEGLMTEREGGNSHISLLAMNNVGYKNLIKLSTESHLKGFYRKPRFDKQLLAEHSDGLIVLSGCAASEISKLITNDKPDEAIGIASWYREVFGDRFYMELQDHSLEFDAKLIQGIVDIGNHLKIPFVCSNDSHYISAEDAETHQILLCVQTQSTLSKPAMNYGTNEFYLKTYDEMHKLFGHIPGAIENTVKIADRCNASIEYGRLELPKPPIVGDKDTTLFLKELVWDGIKKKYGPDHQGAIERARYELSVIEKSGYVNYFLIVWDILNFAKNAGIAYGTRGSVGGSIVAYCLNITGLDPLKYDLLFERFLNPDRVSMPDCDMDFADIDRWKVVNYISDQYGKDHTSQIITFGTLAARAAIRDVGRAMEVELSTIDKVSKLVPTKNPDQSKVTIDDAILQSPDLNVLYNSDMSIKSVINNAKKLEGISRNASTHAAGIVISADPLVENVPLYTTPKLNGTIVTQYTMGHLENIGLLKMDALGLSTLTVIQETCRKANISIGDIPFDDLDTFDLISTGHTHGIFQIESNGMQKLMREDSPKTIEEVANLIALYRPGPMQFLDSYVARHHGQEEIDYLHPALEESFSQTFGIPVYQEQIMRMVSTIAGFSPGKADLVRKAMGKKIHSVMESTRNEFIEGAIANERSEKEANDLWNIIVPHAGYSFNRAHAMAYAKVALQTAYLKAHYPMEFMICYLTAERDNLDKVSEAIAECRRLHIPILMPDVNKSESEFIVDHGGIRFALSAIKGVGSGAADEIVKDRRFHGPYKDMRDFCKRLGTKVGNKRVLDALIMCGAMDELGERNQLLCNVDAVLNLQKKEKKRSRPGQFSLFEDDDDLIEFELSKHKPATRKERLAWEKDMCGSYLSENLLELAAEQLSAAKIRTIDTVTPDLEGGYVRVGGVITEIKKINTKKGDRMAFVKLQDVTGIIEVTIFPRTYNTVVHLLVEDHVVTFKGKVQVRDEKVGILADEAGLLEGDPKITQKNEPEEEGEFTVKVFLTYSPCGDREADNGAFRRLCEVLREHPGDDEATFSIDDMSMRRTFPLPEDCRKVLFDSRLEDAIRESVPTIKLVTTS